MMYCSLVRPCSVQTLVSRARLLNVCCTPRRYWHVSVKNTFLKDVEGKTGLANKMLRRHDVHKSTSARVRNCAEVVQKGVKSKDGAVGATKFPQETIQFENSHFMKVYWYLQFYKESGNVCNALDNKQAAEIWALEGSGDELKLQLRKAEVKRHVMLSWREMLDKDMGATKPTWWPAELEYHTVKSKVNKYKVDDLNLILNVMRPLMHKFLSDEITQLPQEELTFLATASAPNIHDTISVAPLSYGVADSVQSEVNTWKERSDLSETSTRKQLEPFANRPLEEERETPQFQETVYAEPTAVYSNVHDTFKNCHTSKASQKTEKKSSQWESNPRAELQYQMRKSEYLSSSEQLKAGYEQSKKNESPGRLDDVMKQLKGLKHKEETIDLTDLRNSMNASEREHTRRHKMSEKKESRRRQLNDTMKQLKEVKHEPEKIDLAPFRSSMKTYVVMDTCVLLSVENLNMLLNKTKADVVFPQIVVAELDGLKDRASRAQTSHGYRGPNREMLNRNKLLEVARCLISNNPRLITQTIKQASQARELKYSLPEKSSDDAVINCAILWKFIHPQSKVILLTNDTFMLGNARNAVFCDLENIEAYSLTELQKNIGLSLFPVYDATNHNSQTMTTEKDVDLLEEVISNGRKSTRTKIENKFSSVAPTSVSTDSNQKIVYMQVGKRYLTELVLEEDGSGYCHLCDVSVELDELRSHWTTSGHATALQCAHELLGENEEYTSYVHSTGLQKYKEFSRRGGRKVNCHLCRKSVTGSTHFRKSKIHLNNRLALLQLLLGKPVSDVHPDHTDTPQNTLDHKTEGSIEDNSIRIVDSELQDRVTYLNDRLTTPDSAGVIYTTLDSAEIGNIKVGNIKDACYMKVCGSYVVEYVLDKDGRGYCYSCNVGIEPGQQAITDHFGGREHRENMASTLRMFLLEKRNSAVDVLIQLAQKRGWDLPMFEISVVHSPDRNNKFLGKVKVDDTWYQPTIASNKKQGAKSQAAAVALLGLLPKHIKNVYENQGNGGGMDTAVDVVPGMNTAADVVPGMNTAADVVPGMDTAADVVPGMNTAADVLPGMKRPAERFYSPDHGPSNVNGNYFLFGDVSKPEARQTKQVETIIENIKNTERLLQHQSYLKAEDTSDSQMNINNTAETPLDVSETEWEEVEYVLRDYVAKKCHNLDALSDRQKACLKLELERQLQDYQDMSDADLSHEEPFGHEETLVQESRSPLHGRELSLVSRFENTRGESVRQSTVTPAEEDNYFSEHRSVSQNVDLLSRFQAATADAVMERDTVSQEFDKRVTRVAPPESISMCCSVETPCVKCAPATITDSASVFSNDCELHSEDITVTTSSTEELKDDAHTFASEPLFGTEASERDSGRPLWKHTLATLVSLFGSDKKDKTNLDDKGSKS